MDQTDIKSGRAGIMQDLSIDCVIFGFTGSLEVLLVRHAEGISAGQWALPGGWVRYDESLDAAAHSILQKLTGLKEVYLEQLKAFGKVDRFPHERVVTVAYYSLIKASKQQLAAGFTASEVQWYPLNNVPKLIYDHEDILAFARKRLQSRVRQEPIGFNLLPEKFTLHQLQSLYESCLGLELDKPNFRRKISRMKLLIDCGEHQNNVSHRAARLYRFDETVYRKLKEKKFVLDF